MTLPAFFEGTEMPDPGWWEALWVHDRVDYVFLANAFHGVPDKPRLASAVYDVLKPGGLFAVVNWHARPREETIVLGEPRGPTKELRTTPEETIAVVQLSGLAFQRQIEVPPYHYAAPFERKGTSAAMKEGSYLAVTMSSGARSSPQLTTFRRKNEVRGCCGRIAQGMENCKVGRI